MANLQAAIYRFNGTEWGTSKIMFLTTEPASSPGPPGMKKAAHGDAARGVARRLDQASRALIRADSRDNLRDAALRGTT